MKNNLLRLFALLFIVSATVACSKDDPEPDYMKLLTAHTWVMSNAKAETDDPELLERMEGIYLVLSYTQITFNEDGTYSGTDGNGTWEFSSDNKKIIFDQNTYNKTEWPIRELNAGSLKVSCVAVLVDTENNVDKVKINLDLVPKK